MILLYTGSGKTTVARLVGKILAHLGIREDNFTETSGRKLLLDGQAKIAETLKAATPGVLFVDEVYQLDPVNDAGGRAITDMIMEKAENDRTCLTIIVAGKTMTLLPWRGAVKRYKSDLYKLVKLCGCRGGLRSFPSFSFSLSFIIVNCTSSFSFMKFDDVLILLIPHSFIV